MTVAHLANTPENVTTLTCVMLSFFSRLKVCCIPSNVGGSEKSWLWIDVGGSVMRGNWNAKQATSQQVFTVTTFCMDT